MRMMMSNDEGEVGVSTVYSSTQSVSDDIETLYIDKPLVERDVQTHTRTQALRDKTERHIRHDDCCGYCERYCNDKITDVKRREIEAWRHDVTINMELSKALHQHKTKNTRLRYLKYSNIGVPDTEPGFRRIKTPKDLRQSKDKVNKVSKDGEKSNWNRRPRQTIDVSDMSAVYTHDTSVHDTDHGALVPVKTPLSTGFSVDSLDESDSDADTDKPELIPESSQHSYRSCSNELLNVITIDDAIRKHREHLLRNKEIKSAKLSHQVNAPQLALEGISLAEKQPTGGAISASMSSDNSTEIGEFRLHPESAKRSRPGSKFSGTTFSESVDLGFRSSTQISKPQRFLRTPDTYSTDRRARKGRPSNFNVMLRAVDGVVTNHDVPNVNNGRQSSTAKPQSKRFRKMHKNLRNLIDKEYLPNPKMAERLEMFATSSESDALRSNGQSFTPQREPLWVSSAHPAAARQRQKQQQEQGAEQQRREEPAGSSSNGGFLSMLTDYKDSDSGQGEEVE